MNEDFRNFLIAMTVVGVSTVVICVAFDKLRAEGKIQLRGEIMARIETTGGDICYTIPNRDCGLTRGCPNFNLYTYQI